jgi:hypothetical protein
MHRNAFKKTARARGSTLLNINSLLRTPHIPTTLETFACERGEADVAVSIETLVWSEEAECTCKPVHPSARLSPFIESRSDEGDRPRPKSLGGRRCNIGCRSESSVCQQPTRGVHPCSTRTSIASCDESNAPPDPCKHSLCGQHHGAACTQVNALNDHTVFSQSSAKPFCRFLGLHKNFVDY